MDDNLKKVERLLEGAAKEKPDLICLPEFYCLLEKEDSAYINEDLLFEKHPALHHGSEMARRLDCWVLLGSIPAFFDGKTIKNRSVMLSSNGEVAAYYDKIHLFDVAIRDGQVYRESQTVSAGSEVVTVDLPWGRCGLTICYDVRFPHLYRALSKCGALFITVPAAFTYKTGKAHWHTLVRARAIENGCYVFAPSQCGTRFWGRKTFGHSLIVDPWGNILAEGTGEEGVIYANIDVSSVARARTMIPSLEHDREIYVRGQVKS